MSYLYEVFEHLQLLYRHMTSTKFAGEMSRHCAVASMSLQNQANRDLVVQSNVDLMFGYS
jgi:hypothetical protein